MSKVIPMDKALALLVGLAACAGLPAQRTWRVHCGGGTSADFPDLPPAVAAAAPGDTIWLILDSQSCSVQYTGAVIDKPLTIVGMTPFGVPGVRTALFANIAGALEVANITIGQRVVLSNLRVLPKFTGVLPVPPHGIHVTDCAGEILFEGVYYHGYGLQSSVMRIERCANVTLRGCDLSLSGEALTLEDSTATLTNTVVRWVGPHPQQQFRYTQTSPALWLQRSHATVIASTLDGASDGGMTNYWAMPGALVESGDLDIGPYSLLRGGNIFNTRWTGIQVNSPSIVRIDSRALVVNGLGGIPPLVHADLDSTFHDYLIGGEIYHVSVAGPRGGWGLMTVGSATLQPVPLPGVGLLAIEPATLSVIGLQPLAAQDGWSEWTSRVPANVPTGHVFAFQCATLAPNGTIALALPSPFTVAWPNGWIP